MVETLRAEPKENSVAYDGLGTLVREAQDGDKGAEYNILSIVMPLVQAVVGSYRINPKDPKYDDFVGYGVTGVFRALGALKKRDLTHVEESYFVPYFLKAIRSQMQEAWRGCEGRIVSIPSSVYEVTDGWKKTHAELTASLGRNPGDDEIAAASGIAVEEYREAAAIRTQIVYPDSDKNWWDRTSERDRQLGGRDPGFDRVDAEDTVNFLLERLTDEERRVVELRYLDDTNPNAGGYSHKGSLASQEDFAVIIGTPISKVKRLECRAMQKMRERGYGHGLERRVVWRRRH